MNPELEVSIGVHVSKRQAASTAVVLAMLLRASRSLSGWPRILQTCSRQLSTLNEHKALWEERAKKELKGKNPHEALAWHTSDVRSSRAPSEAFCLQLVT
jgi:hypothetical protein